MSTSTMQSSILQMPAIQTLENPRRVQKRQRLMIVDKPQFSAIIQQMLHTRYDVVCVDDAVCALKQISSEKPDLVIVEATVNGNGLLLAELMKMSPGLCDIPLIVTCLEPTDELVARVKGANIASLIAKPFRPSTLVTQVEIELLRFESEGGEDRQNVPAGLDAFGGSSLNLGAFVGGKVGHEDDFFELLQNDTQCQEAILRLANTAYSPEWREIDSFKLAVGMMGIREAKAVALCVQIFRALQSRAEKGSINWMSLCKYSVGTALIARSLAKKIAIDAEQAFLAGLLHDLGKGALGGLFADYYAEVRGVVQERKLASSEAEKKLLGMTHAHVGMLMATLWGAGEQVAGAVAWHHKPTVNGKHTKLAGLIYVASAICAQLEYGSGGEVVKSKQDGLLEKVLWKLGVSPQAFDSFVDAGKEELVYANKLLAALFQK